MSSTPRTTVVTFQDFSALDFAPPATWYIQNAMGDYVFVHTRDRMEAQTFVDEEYGKGRYTVKASKMQQAKGDLTCRGTATRKGQRKPS
ncbi:hypothetical protein [Pseudomonas phage vB_PaeM_PAO1_Ab03]|uniref:Uncharacterized protein n=1 Tax=Pseudomonas phage vB_PaeM_PAO1_Ab03 TaxID=1548901 RepID=A0A0A1IW37_9CAUD|nr:hypothetical protein VC54_gp049 [Pseudomonas phage vB_PaeM_PAO1_Ab03]CEF89154.1 hypothetical protein [Pseudomonas phage vB_PaeM_PAO1_Ab03]